MKKKKLLLVFAFLLLLALSFSAITDMFCINSKRAYSYQRGFTREKRGSLDAVFIGSSNVHAFWQPMLGWTQHGIASYNYSFDSVPIGAIKYLIKEARKTQPDALYVITLNTYKRKTLKDSIEGIHRVSDYMPLSRNKIDMINFLADTSRLTREERLELFFPIIRFHSRWDDLQSWSLGASYDDYKSSMNERFFLRDIVDLSDSYALFDTRSDLPEDTLGAFVDLLDYLDGNQVNALFIKVPQALIKQHQGRLNLLEDILGERGYPCLDMLEAYREIGLDTRLDFYNEFHTNLHGSLKVTEYISNYLVENYHFDDKRGQDGWKSWDELIEPYMDMVGANALPFEIDHARRVETAVPTLGEPRVEDMTATITWETVDGAEGYEVYRKNRDEENGRWRLCVAVDADAATYRDTGLAPGSKYTYTVVPLCPGDGETLHGSFDAIGVSGKTQGDAPAVDAAVDPEDGSSDASGDIAGND